MTKTDRENAAIVGDGLVRWYAARGSRSFTGVWEFRPVPAPRLICGTVSAFCDEPAKMAKFGPRCATHWPRIAG